MEMAQLETFLAIIEEHGFSRAALRLNRTQPAVSQTIRKLEEELSEQLFERSSRDGTVTAAGAVLEDYARRLLRLRGEAASAVEELRSLERGRLTLAANEYTSHLLLPVLAAYRRSCPQITVVVERTLASRIADALLQRNVELGLLSFRPESDALEAIAIYEDDVAFVVDPAHPLAGQDEVSVRELGAQNFIAHSVASPLRRQVLAVFAACETPLRMGVELPSLESVKRFVAMGVGIAFLPGLTVAREVERGELVRVRVPELDSRRQLFLVHRRQGVLSHAARALIRVLESLAAERGEPFQFRRVQFRREV